MTDPLAESIFKMMTAMNRVRADEVLDKLEMDALRGRFADDEKLEGRRLNHEAYIDGRREAEAMDRNREE